mmetsp:Transcript_65715/g.136886  ORF Transcript_65715/g.136886 Transcript_65715/m.136886 type:complete len:212 (-) Transcript_65715:1356-1991(-)
MPAAAVRRSPSGAALPADTASSARGKLGGVDNGDHGRTATAAAGCGSRICIELREDPVGLSEGLVANGQQETMPGVEMGAMDTSGGPTACCDRPDQRMGGAMAGAGAAGQAGPGSLLRSPSSGSLQEGSRHYHLDRWQPAHGTRSRGCSRGGLYNQRIGGIAQTGGRYSDGYARGNGCSGNGGVGHAPRRTTDGDHRLVIDALDPPTVAQA